MKTTLATLLALGLLSTAASAQYCPPGHGFHRPAHATARVLIDKTPVATPAPAPAPTAPAAPIEPAPITPAPESAPPK
jgi:hypothetical protein